MKDGPMHEGRSDARAHLGRKDITSEPGIREACLREKGRPKGALLPIHQTTLALSALLNLDFDVYSGRQIEALESVNCFGRMVDNVN